MSAPCGRAHLDWPLSRDEKKFHVMQLYDRELRARDDSSNVHPEVCTMYQEDCAEGWRKLRLSDASTAASELGASMTPLCGDQLDPITEEVDAPFTVTANERDPQACNIAAQLRLAVANAVNATLRDFESHASVASSSICPAGQQNRSSSAEHVGPLWRRSVSEDIARSGSRRRTSFGRRNSTHHTPRGSRSRADSRSIPECGDSDGAEGDTEHPQRYVEIAPARRRWRLWNENQRKVERTCGRRAQSCNSVMTSAADNRGGRRSAPSVQADSLQDFLGESVPQCPW